MPDNCGLEARPARLGEAGSSHIQLFAADAASPVRWRLLSGNNRDLGRGVAAYSDPESCALAVKDLQVRSSALTPRVRRLTSGGWGWELLDGEAAVAVSGRPFDRLIRCEQGLEQFVIRLAEATVRGPLMLSASRRWVKAV